MKTSAIKAMKPNVSREEALRVFNSGVFSAAYWRIRNGPLQRIADVYVPFWVYQVRYEVVGASKARIFALEAVAGALDLFEFPGVPLEDELQAMETRNVLLPGLEPEAAEGLLRMKVLRLLFQQGFFKLRALKVEITHMPGEVHLPYWLAFYGHHGAAKCRALDAVRRRIEGAKASYFFEQWLAA